MNTTAAREATRRPTADRAHADAVAAEAARRARRAGASIAECAQVYADTYAVVLRG